MYGIPKYGYITIYQFSCWTFSLFPVFATRNNVATNIPVPVFLNTRAKEPQEYVLRIGIAGLRIYTSSTFLDIAKLLSKVDALVYTLSSKHKTSCFFLSSPNLVLS